MPNDDDLNEIDEQDKTEFDTKAMSCLTGQIGIIPRYPTTSFDSSCPPNKKVVSSTNHTFKDLQNDQKNEQLQKMFFSELPKTSDPSLLDQCSTSTPLKTSHSSVDKETEEQRVEVKSEDLKHKEVDSSSLLESLEQVFNRITVDLNQNAKLAPQHLNFDSSYLDQKEKIYTNKWIGNSDKCKGSRGFTSQASLIKKEVDYCLKVEEDDNGDNKFCGEQNVGTMLNPLVSPSTDDSKFKVSESNNISKFTWVAWKPSQVYCKPNSPFNYLRHVLTSSNHLQNQHTENQKFCSEAPISCDQANEPSFLFVKKKPTINKKPSYARTQKKRAIIGLSRHLPAKFSAHHIYKLYRRLLRESAPGPDPLDLFAARTHLR